MAFNIIENGGRTLWMQGDGASTYYKGQIVMLSTNATTECDGTCTPLSVPSGAADTTQLNIPFGIIVGFNKRTPTTTTLGTLLVEYDGGACVTQAAQLAREFTGQEGMYGKADPSILIQVAEINSLSILRGPVYNAAYGTAPTLLTSTAVGGTDGMVTADTTNACDFTNVTKCGTIYCRAGANMGLYRVSKDTSTTAPSVTTAFPYDTAIGDQYVRVPFKQGNSNIYIAGPGMYVDCSKNPVIAATNLYNVVVYKMDLSTAGREYVDFRFGGDHFCRFRA